MSKKQAAILVIVLLLWTVLGVSTTMAADKMAVAVNQSRVMAVDGVKRVAIANPEIADVLVVSGSEVLLVGKAPGLTTLHIWTPAGRQSYLVEVAADNVPVANEIKTILGYSGLSVSKINNTVILEGTVADQNQKARAEKVASAYGDKVINLLEVTAPVQVKIEAKVIEIDRTKSKELGLNFWGNSSGKIGMFSFGQSLDNQNSIWGDSLGNLGSIHDINGNLSALIEGGKAKVLSQPNIITLSGDKASILIGGQIPVPVAADNGKVTVEWKNYGIALEIAPEVTAQGLIMSRVKAEVSSLDDTNAVKLNNIAIPALKMRKAEATLALASGQTMAIGGLIANETAKDVTKLPLLSDIPVLGRLFQSTSFKHGETELIILVTPTIVNAANYVPRASDEMKAFGNQAPWGGKNDGRQNQSADR